MWEKLYTTTCEELMATTSSMERKLAPKVKINLEDLKNIKDNYLVIEIDYSNKLVFTFKEGMKFLKCLKKAEKLTDPYDGERCIIPLNVNYTVQLIDHQSYCELKMKTLLNPNSE